jgi:hypothetical protein
MALPDRLLGAPLSLAFFLTATALFGTSTVSAQNFAPDYNPLFDDTRVATVRITIAPSVLDSILAPGNEQSDYEHPAMFEYDDGTGVETVERIGFRLRGNTSRVSAKKSFKVSFNTWVSGQRFHDVEKLNLNGEHNDPSIIRSKVAWDLFQGHGVAAPRASHVQLYINDEYRGLYANVEHIDEQFLKSRFGNDAGTLYKSLYPADLSYLGPDAEDYRPTDASRRPYDLKLRDSDDEGYDDLAHFIDVLNNTPEPLFATEIEKVFDVNSFLRSLAVDIVTGSWDNYWFLMNNYYLYNNPNTGLFVYIPYDFDNTFGIWFDGIEPGADWATRDLYNWGSQNEARPLTDRILSNPSYQDRLSYFIDQILADVFVPDDLKPRIDELHALVTPAAEADTFRTIDYGYTVQDFHNSFIQPLGGHVTYGLKPFVDARYMSALEQVDPGSIRPIILDAWYSPPTPSAAEAIQFYATVLDDQPGQSAAVEYTVDGVTARAPMFDDGSHGDGDANDGRFATSLPPFEENVSMAFRFVGIEMSGRESYTTERNVDVGYSGAPLFINELMASNDTTVTDPFGDNDDWVEIYNGGENPIPLAGHWFTDDLTDPTKWAAPDTAIEAGAYMILWLDEEEDQGPLHGSFKLSADGEQFGIFDSTLQVVDAVSFGEQHEDVAYGRTVDGGGQFAYLLVATPGGPNITDTGTDNTDRGEQTWTLSAYPNPFRGQLALVVEAPAGSTTPTVYLEVFDALGRRVKKIRAGIAGASARLKWDGRDAAGAPIASGLYLIRVVDDRGRQVAATSVIRAR